jgi:signal peptidase I
VFGLFASQEKKMRSHAANWLELAEKVYHYRRDVLPPAELAELQSRSAQLQAELKAKSDSAKLKLSIEALETVLRRTGGKVYPKSSLVENVEFFLVAAIVILGIRTYFVQPFKIPTNSMWPSYHGMTPEVFRTKAEEPGTVTQAVRFLAFGARARRLDAPQAGEVLIPMGNPDGRGGAAHYRVVSGRSWFVFPTKLREYTLFVNDAPVSVTVPLDFDFDWALTEAFYPAIRQARSGLRCRRSPAASLWSERSSRMAGGCACGSCERERTVAAGERILSFDIMTGDQLFVDRMSYHFRGALGGQRLRLPHREHIPGIYNIHGDQYYIKRLVGGPGDTLEVVRGETKTSDGSSRLLASETTGDPAAQRPADQRIRRVHPEQQPRRTLPRLPGHRGPLIRAQGRGATASTFLPSATTPTTAPMAATGDSSRRRTS